MEPVTGSELAPDGAAIEREEARLRSEFPRPKVRSRKHGSAVPIDETDRKLLNLLQSKFPLEPRPFLRIAEFAELTENEVLKRTARLVKNRIIREMTPIFDTRALGYSSMLVAAKVDAANPHRPAAVINSYPGVSHNYLRNHDFNIWFTIATPPDSKLGLQGTLEVIAGEAGATSMRQLPTLKLFKINMNLEMEQGTEALTAEGEVAQQRKLETGQLTELDYAVIRNLQGRLTATPEPYAEAAALTGITVDQLLAHCEEMISRGLLRRVAAILFHRRAGFSANGMGVWRVPKDQVAEVGPRMASFRGISHCYERPTYEDWPYSVFTMAHGRSKKECDAILDEIAEATGFHGEDRSILYSSTEFKKTRLRFFTPDYAEWEAARA